MSELAHPPDAETDYERVQRSPEFQALRRRFRAFVFPMTGLFLAWYLLYVLLAAYAPDFMGIRVAGNITVGLLFGQDTLAAPDMQTKYDFQRAGLGFGFLPAAWVREDIAQGRFVVKEVEEPKPDETLYLAWRTGEEGAALRCWRERLRTSGSAARLIEPR